MAIIPVLNINFVTLVAQVFKGVVLALGVVAIGAVLYLINYFLNFNISVFLFEKIGEGYKLITDRGKLTVFNEKSINPDKKDGEYKALQRKSFKYPYPDSQNFFF